MRWELRVEWCRRERERMNSVQVLGWVKDLGRDLEKEMARGLVVVEYCLSKLRDGGRCRGCSRDEGY